MNVNSINLAINSLALLGVVIALFNLVFQMKSVKKQLELQNFLEYTRRYQDIMLNLPESIHVGTFKFSETRINENDLKAIRFIRAFYDLSAEEFFLHNNGLINNATWRLWKKGIFATINNRAFHEAWTVIRPDTHHPEAFIRFIDEFYQSTNMAEKSLAKK